MHNTMPNLPQVNEDTLKNRMFYLLMNCPLLAGQRCQANRSGAINTGAATGGLPDSTASASYRGGKQVTLSSPLSDNACVSLHVNLPYKLRREALAAGINCSELLRKALRRRLRKLAQF